MPVRPPSGQVDGQSQLTQSPMTTQGFNQQMMPPPNSMGYVPTPGKMGGSQIPGHYPQYNSQFPQGNYGRQQPNMGAMSGSSPSGPMQSYPGSQPSIYPNSPGQMPGTAMYGNLPGMVRSQGQQGYGPAGQGPYSQTNTSIGGMMNNHYPSYNSHMVQVPGHPGMQQAPGGSGPMPPGPASGQGVPSMSGQQGSMMSQQLASANKAAQAAQAAMLAANSSLGPRMSHGRGSISPSRGMFMHSGGGPLAHMNNMANSPDLGSPSLNSMSHAIEELARSSSGGMPSLSMGNLSASAPSPVPHFSAAVSSNSSTNIINSGDHNVRKISPQPNAETHDSLSRPSSATTHHPDLPINEPLLGSDISGGMPSDSTSVDSGFHSSDQSDKNSDSVSTPTQLGSSPPLSCHAPSEDTSRIIENISPPDHASHYPQHHHLHQHHLQQQHYHMGPESKMPYCGEGDVPLPPSAMSSMPSSSSSVVTTASAGPSLTSVTQSIASPVTSVSTSVTTNHPHPHPHHMGPHGGSPHMMGHGMGPGSLGMIPNGMPPSGVINPGQMGGPNQMQANMGGPNQMQANIGGPNQMPPNMGGPRHSMMPQHMGGSNMNMNHSGPLMGPMMGHNGPMMPGHPGMNSGVSSAGMFPMGQMPPQQQMNCMPPVVNNNSSSSKNKSDEPPEKKKKLKKSALDVNKLFEMGSEPDRRHFLERIFAFLEESGQPVTALPVISKIPLDLYKLYFSVREKGGFEEVTRSKKWRDVCTVVSIGTSASAAFTLKKNYIRYLLNYECKYDRGGISSAPILAQMEAQLAHKREQKSRRAPSPAGSNSSESIRPPSVPSSQGDSSYQAPNMPPPYMQNTDSSMSNSHMSGNAMMGPNSMMAGPSPHGGMGHMIAGSPDMGPSGVLGGPGPNVMHGQQGMIPSAGAVNMMGPQMSGGPPGYGGPVLHQQSVGPMSQPLSGGAIGPPLPTHGGVSAAGPAQVNSDSFAAQDPFAEESDYPQPRGGPLQPTPPPQSLPAATSTPIVSGYSGMQQSSMGSVTVTSTASQPLTSAVGYGGPDQMMSGFPPNVGRLSEPPVSTTTGQLSFGQHFERSDRFDQPIPTMAMRPPCPAPGMTTSQQHPPQTGENSAVYSGARFPGPHQAVGMRPPHGGDVPGQYPQQGPTYQGQSGYHGTQYPNYPQNSDGPYPGPRPPPGPGGMFGTPSKQFPEDHPVPNRYSEWSNSAVGSQQSYSSAPPDRQAPSPDERIQEGGQWSPLPKSRMPQSRPGYMSPAPPSTPPIAQQMSHKKSAQGRVPGQQKMPPSYGGLAAACMAKKEIPFPPDSVESVSMSTAKRKTLTSKDLAQFEPWRLMLALKSGLLAESTWALDTLNILLYDDTTNCYFGLRSLPGLLEVLTEHFRHCLKQMFTEFKDLENLSEKPVSRHDKPEPVSTSKPGLRKENSESTVQELEKKGKLVVFLLSGSNYTIVSRKGVPVKIDKTPADNTVLDGKEWDVYSKFNPKSDHWASGRGDMTDHIVTHLESEKTNKFLSGRFRRKRTREGDGNGGRVCNGERVCNGVHFSQDKRNCVLENVTQTPHSESRNCAGSCGVAQPEMCEKSVLIKSEYCDVKTEFLLHEPFNENSNPDVNHSSMCNGGKVLEEKNSLVVDSVCTGNELLHVNKEPSGEQEKIKSYSKVGERRKKKAQKFVRGKTVTESIKVVKSNEMLEKATVGEGTETVDMEVDSKYSEPVKSGDLEEPKLSPIVNHIDSDSQPCSSSERNVSSLVNSRKANTFRNSSPPVLRAESFDDNEDTASEGTSEPMNSSMNSSCIGARMGANVSAVEDTSCPEDSKDLGMQEIKMEEAGVKEHKEDTEKVSDDSTVNTSLDTILTLNESYVSETEELSSSIVADMLKEDENLEEEAFQKDDPPLCLTPESKDELGRRCVCISNIIRSLSCVPGNEDHICRHPGIMRVLGQLLLLHHSHPEKPPPRKLPSGAEEEEREQLPRVYDDQHWWWNYLDQLRENTLVIVANICGYLRLGNFSEQVCFPLLEGLLHWVICPASVARDPLPTLPAGSVLSPQRLVLEALCKLCIYETNVDLLLATPPVKRLLELFSVLVRLLADRNHQITQEFSIVLLSLLVSGESSAARAVALQHPSVSLLVDFIETAEQNALSIANQQGPEVLQVNPEVMGTSPDMLRRAASILLHMARVPDNRKMFVQQQSRLLNLVMSQILDHSVSNTLSEVLFECSQVS